MVKQIPFQRLKQLEGLVGEYAALGDDFVLSRFTAPVPREGAEGPVPLSIDGLVVMLCLGGAMTLIINQQQVSLEAGQLMVIRPGWVMSGLEVGAGGIDCYSLFLSPAFLQSTNIDPKVMMLLPVEQINQTAPLSLDDAQQTRLRTLINLIGDVASQPGAPVIQGAMSRSLVCSMFYSILQAVVDRRDTPGRRAPGPSRPSAYADQFMRLVHAHFTKERSVAFYAGKLGITPRYLTRLVREATGRRPVDWINDFVILEAKNRLKFSGQNVKQVAYALNFPTQSTFGKFFRQLTGITPSRYQRT